MRKAWYKDMQELERIVEEAGYRITGFVRDEEVYYSNLYAISKATTHPEIVISITAPHSGNGFKFLLRADYAASHDRWSNAVYEEEFRDVAGVLLELFSQNIINKVDKRSKIWYNIIVKIKKMKK